MIVWLPGIHCVNRTLRTRAITAFPGAERGGAGLSIRRALDAYEYGAGIVVVCGGSRLVRRDFGPLLEVRIQVFSPQHEHATRRRLAVSRLLGEITRYQNII